MRWTLNPKRQKSSVFFFVAIFFCNYFCENNGQDICLKVRGMWNTWNNYAAMLTGLQLTTASVSGKVISFPGSLLCLLGWKHCRLGARVPGLTEDVPNSNPSWLATGCIYFQRSTLPSFVNAYMLRSNMIVGRLWTGWFFHCQTSKQSIQNSLKEKPMKRPTNSNNMLWKF